jgi:hypothetical protein
MDDADDGLHVRAPTLEDVVRICRSLNENAARYVLIGGFAVIAHGGARTTKDIDFLVDSSPENIARIKTALRILSDNAAEEIDDRDVEKYSVVRVADEVLVDLLAKACDVTYKVAIQDAETIELGGIVIPLASKRTLIESKKTIRPSDRIDTDFLAFLIEEEDKDKF